VWYVVCLAALTATLKAKGLMFSTRWRSLAVLGTKVASFPKLMWGVVFTACTFFFFFLFHASQDRLRA